MQKKSKGSTGEPQAAPDPRPQLMLMIGERQYLIAKLQGEVNALIARLDEIEQKLREAVA